MKFKHRLYMKVTEKQFRSDLECQLKQLGYKNEIGKAFRKNIRILLTDNTEKKGNVFRTTSLDWWNNPPKDTIKIERYNPELFLAIAAMTEGEDWIVGEYLVTKIYGDPDIDRIFKCKELKGANHESNRASLNHKHLYRKATLEELYKHFNYLKPKETKRKYKFEEGDVVEIVKYGYGCSRESLGQKATILEKGEYFLDPGYIISDIPKGSHNSMSKISFCDFVGEESFKKVEKKDVLLPDKKLDKSWAEKELRNTLGTYQTISEDSFFKKLWEEDIPKESFIPLQYPLTPDECYPKTSTKIERPKEILIKLRKSKKNKLKF